MFWCIKNQLKIGDICWRCNCTCQIELIRLSNRLHYNLKFIKYSWLIKKSWDCRYACWKRKIRKKILHLLPYHAYAVSLSLSFFKVCKYSKLSFRNLAFPLHGSFAISTVSFPVLIFSILPKNLYRNCGIGGLSNKITGVFMLKWREKVWIYFEYNKNWIIYVCLWNIIGKRADTPQSFIFWC